MLYSAHASLFTQLEEVHSQYKELEALIDQEEVKEEVVVVERSALEEIISWQHDYQDTLTSIPKISMKQQHRDGLLIKTWDEENHVVKEGISEVSKIVKGLWNSSLEILSSYEMEMMDLLP